MGAEAIESVILYVGQAACLLASVGLVMAGRRLEGVLMLVGFAMQFQFGFVAEHLPEGTGECWAARISYYECLPIWFRISAYSAQLGLILVAVGIGSLAMSALRAKIRKE